MKRKYLLRILHELKIFTQVQLVKYDRSDFVESHLGGHCWVPLNNVIKRSFPMQKNFACKNSKNTTFGFLLRLKFYFDIYPGTKNMSEPDKFWTNLRASARPEAEPAEESRKRKFWINFDFPKVKVTREFLWLPVAAPVLYQSSFRIWMGKLLLITLLSGTQQWPPRWLSHQILTISFDKLYLRKDFRFTEYSS